MTTLLNLGRMAQDPPNQFLGLSLLKIFIEVRYKCVLIEMNVCMYV
jgi:hypothetical protein